MNISKTLPKPLKAWYINICNVGANLGKNLFHPLSYWLITYNPSSHTPIPWIRSKQGNKSLQHLLKHISINHMKQSLYPSLTHQQISMIIPNRHRQIKPEKEKILHEEVTIISAASNSFTRAPLPKKKKRMRIEAYREEDGGNNCLHSLLENHTFHNFHLTN